MPASKAGKEACISPDGPLNVYNMQVRVLVTQARWQASWLRWDTFPLISACGDLLDGAACPRAEGRKDTAATVPTADGTVTGAQVPGGPSQSSHHVPRCGLAPTEALGPREMPTSGPAGWLRRGDRHPRAPTLDGESRKHPSVQGPPPFLGDLLPDHVSSDAFNRSSPCSSTAHC